MSDDLEPPVRRSIRRTLGRVIEVVAVGVMVLGLATARVVVAGEQEIAASTQALERGAAAEAIVHARSAAGWYAPGAPHVRLAYERLRALAIEAEQRRRHELALFAWRSIRTAALETRWLVVPHAADLERADAEIARLMATPLDERGMAGEPDPALRSTSHAQLQARFGPRLAWVIVLLGGLASAATGFVLWARRMGRSALRLRGKSVWALSWEEARVALLLVLGGAVLWLLALWRA